MIYDVVVVGGGPAGLQAALTLGRARKHVLLCHAGPPRNAAAHQLHNFVTRDGIAPAEFRALAREQLTPYPNVEQRDFRVRAIEGTQSDFVLEGDGAVVRARRVLLTMGMIDELPPIAGLAERWGHSVFQCPYCHAWEIQEGHFGVLADSEMMLEFSMFLRGWSRSVVAYTNAAVTPSAELIARLESAGVHLETAKLLRLGGLAPSLEQVELEDGRLLRCDALFARPPQRQPDLVNALGLKLDTMGFVQVDEQQQSSVAGIYVAGDMLTPRQSAVTAASSGMMAAAMLNHTLTLEQLARSELR